MADLSYVCGTSDQPLIGRTVGQELVRAARARPEGDAIVAVHQNVRLSYAGLLEVADRVGAALLRLGVEPGARVGIWSANRWEWSAVQYGTSRIGAILVNVDPAYRSHELAFVLAHAGISVLVTAPTFRATDYLPMLDEALPQAPGVRHVVLLDALGSTDVTAPDWAEPWTAFLERSAEARSRPTRSPATFGSWMSSPRRSRARCRSSGSRSRPRRISRASSRSADDRTSVAVQTGGVRPDEEGA